MQRTEDETSELVKNGRSRQAMSTGRGPEKEKTWDLLPGDVLMTGWAELAFPLNVCIKAY